MGKKKDPTSQSPAHDVAHKSLSRCRREAGGGCGRSAASRSARDDDDDDDVPAKQHTTQTLPPPPRPLQTKAPLAAVTWLTGVRLNDFTSCHLEQM